MTIFTNYSTPISAEKANAQLQTADDFTLSVGCPTCPCCHRFKPELVQVAKGSQLTIHFLDGENQDSDMQELRTTYNAPTVPGLLVAKSGHVRIVYNSPLSEEAILDFITH